MMKEIKAVDYIIANQLGYLAGNVVALITEWQITRNITALEAAQQEIANLLERERFIEDRLERG
jgi:exo-beta-1,3-glucanase (GH17 family)|tara:strand:+ start:5048 stop:5239 length:192 start_codon:yes stop_codon:yes gene_type:complete